MNKYTIIFPITSYCNLKCTSCDQFCGQTEEKWYISLEDVKMQLSHLKEKCHHLQNIEITGGEACLHPNFLEICQLFSETFPNINIFTTTNGTLLKKSKEIIEKIQNEFKIKIRVSLYPSMLNFVKKQIEEKKLNNLNFISKPFFNKISYFNTVKNKTKEKINCKFYIRNQYFLYKGNFYPCASFITMSKINFLLIKDNIINLYNMQNEEELLSFIEGNFNLCRFCNNCNLTSCDILYHSLSNKNSNDYSQTMKTLFLTDIDKYDNLLKISNELKQSLTDEFFIGNININNDYKKLYNRLFGETDICILINKNTNFNKINFILTENTNLYFIIVDDDFTLKSKLYDYIYKTFTNNGVYITNKNSYNEAIEWFEQNSFCKIKNYINTLED